MKQNGKIDMCNGPLLGKLIWFSVPLILSGILQLLFNAADLAVVGRFAGETALAAVGSTSSLVNLMVNISMGLAVATNVLVARFYGAKKDKDVEEMVHTSILAALICGIILIFIGFFFAGPILKWMGSPDDVRPLSVAYIRCYFIGMPASMIYNFGSGILRAIGDTKRPTIYITLAGILNFLLNLVFVLGLHLDAMGVGLATGISQFLAAGLILKALMSEEGSCRLEIKRLRIVKDKMLKLLQVGIPAGMQGTFFSLSNVLIQSSVNSFGSIVMAGNTAGMNIEGFVYTSMNAFHQTAVSFTSQNYGAQKFDRIKKITAYCLVLVTVVGLVTGVGAFLASPWLLQIYSTKAEVIAYGILRMSIISVTYFLCGVMEVFVGVIRGLGRSVMPMVVSLLGSCVFRVVWIFTVFASIRTLKCLYISYPVSWILTSLAHAICLIYVMRKVTKSRSQTI